MNQAYRLIWNAAKDVWIVAAEKVKGKGRCPAGTVKAPGVSVGTSGLRNSDSYAVEDFPDSGDIKASLLRANGRSLPFSSLMMALEPRFMFDAAGAATAAVVVADRHHADAALPDKSAEQAKHHHDQFSDYSGRALDNGRGDSHFDVLNALAHHRVPGDRTGQEQDRQGSSVLFVDPRVQDIQALIAGVKPGIEVVFLDAQKDGVSQISSYLQSHTNVSSIYIFSHGSAGSIEIGTTNLDTVTITDRSAEISAWSSSLTKNADILLYGCDVAAGSTGSAFIGQLARTTGADVAASTDATGAASKGGNWVLEAATGPIEARSPLTNKAMAGYEALMTLPTAAAQSATVAEAGTKNFTGETFGFADADSNTLASITITALPNAADGTLKLSGVNVTTNQVITAANFANLVFTPANKTSNYDATLQFKVTDSNSEVSSSSYTYTLHVTAANATPVAGADTGSVNAALSSTPTTTLSVAAAGVLANDTDADTDATLSVSAVRLGNTAGAGTAGTVGSALVGTYGTLTLNSTGGYSYVLDNTNATVIALGTGDTLHEYFNYTVQDNGGATATNNATLDITIHGINDAPVVPTPLNLVFTTPVPENATNAENPGVTVSSMVGTTVSGTVLVTDLDTLDTAPGIAAYGSSTTDGMTGHWEYKPNGSGTWNTMTLTTNSISKSRVSL